MLLLAGHYIQIWRYINQKNFNSKSSKTWAMWINFVIPFYFPPIFMQKSWKLDNSQQFTAVLACNVYILPYPASPRCKISRVLVLRNRYREWCIIFIKNTVAFVKTRKNIFIIHKGVLQELYCIKKRESYVKWLTTLCHIL